MSNFYQQRDFNIVSNICKDVDACAQFTYKGYQISFSTLGRSQGACHTHVCIFTGLDFHEVLEGGFATVQDAIVYIDTLV